ncbi:MAG: putative transcriptional regulator, Crp/Fnr family [Hyphomicrobiales bacterium]|nr:putative transcriptional regulator, Crp/Fnr family [Hyphomicrobiales bacterium]
MLQNSLRNKLLQKFPAADFDRLKPDLRLVEMKLRDVLVRPGYPIDHVYFPESGQISVLAKVAQSEPIEVGMIGWEGMSDMIPTGRSPLESIVQVPGEAHRVDRELLMRVTRESAELSDLLLRYENFLLMQLSFTALSHGGFSIDERLARWLLMVHDRVEGDQIPLVHEFFSWMLAVRRPGVTNAFKTLRECGAIETGRGFVTIRDRDMLIDIAAGSYGPAEAEYEKLIGVPATKGRHAAK